MLLPELRHLLCLTLSLWLGVALCSEWRLSHASPSVRLALPPRDSGSGAERAHLDLNRELRGDSRLAALLGTDLKMWLGIARQRGACMVTRERVEAGAIGQAPRRLADCAELAGRISANWSDAGARYELRAAATEPQARLSVMRGGTKFLVHLRGAGGQVREAMPSLVWRSLGESAAELATMFIPNLFSAAVVYGGFAGLLFWMVHRRQLGGSVLRKVRPGEPRKGQVKQEVMISALALAAVVLYGAPLIFIVEGRHGRIYDHIDELGVAYWLGSLAALLLLVDAYEYWTHRAVHWKPVFKIVHKLHHYSVHPTPWTTFSLNLYEMIISAAFLPLVALAMPLHRSTIAVFSIFTLLKNVTNHLGYQWISAGRFEWLAKWVVGPRFHELHHVYFDCNYSAYFTFWDHWMGTAKLDFEQRVAHTAPAADAPGARADA
jgi:lathosterol oxidase